MKKVYYPELDETLYTRVLENGLTVCVIPRQGFTKKLAYFVTDYGSIHTDFVLEGKVWKTPAGVAHYLEHKMFDLPGKRDVSTEFAAMGAMTNAFTSYDMTAYYFSCTENFDDCLRLLLEFVSTPYFTEESVEKERGIIDQEIGMNLDSPDSVIFDNLTRALFARHPIRVPILGTSETIREITPEILHACHRAFYTPGNMLLCVIGDVEPESVITIARDMLGDEKKEVGLKIRNWEEAMASLEPEVTASMEVAMPMFDLAFKCEGVGTGDAAIRTEMVADLAAEALFGESSELYLKLYEDGLIDTSFGGGFETIDGCAMLMCSGDSQNAPAVREAILAQAEKIAKEGIDSQHFLRMKRSALGRRIRSLDSFDATCFRVCAYHFSGFDYFRFPEIYRSIEAAEICGFLNRVVKQERSCLSVIEPVGNE
ncbi:MAG: insulinase family protein [Oscillospiraceae bacterium]|nr:insulinase family protein [Oscillospiraceae bacterium]MBQ7130483.1 insulinase family protein [Oscillospiraceae bacterium]